LFGFAVPTFIANKNYNPWVHKRIFQLPIFVVSAYCGVRLWEKLTGHYLNFEDTEVAHDFKINYEERFKLYDNQDLEKKQEDEFTLKQLAASSVNFEPQGRNNSEAAILSQIRNLENIVYVNEEDLNKVKTSLELQLLIDSVVPTVIKFTPEEKVKHLQNILSDIKLDVENSLIFKSEKDRMLGLPFQMQRHRQYPEPFIGTWQYNLYEELYGVPFHEGKGEIETEEKIHKFNYKKFLHPSIIEKFNDDPDCPEFDMFIKQKNLEMKTRLERLKEDRTYFCKNILPTLNQLNDEEKGKHFAYYLINKEKHGLKKHFYDAYSGQKEEQLFREAEELRLLNKNPQLVSDVEMSTVKDQYKGIRAKELKKILSDPHKNVEVENALKEKYITYKPASKWDNYKRDRNRLGLIDTAIEEGLDINSSENNYEKLYSMTYDNPDRTEDEEAALNPRVELYDSENSHPLVIHPAREIIYTPGVNFNDYSEVFNDSSLLSAKTMRYENRQKEEERLYLEKFARKYANPEHKSLECTFVPHKERENEEYSEKIFKRKPIDIFNDRLCLYKSELNDINNFINSRVHQDSSRISPDLTEDDLNQALFEAQYQKSVEETEEFKKLDKRNVTEIESMFQALKLTPDELWDDPVDKSINQLKRRPYTEFAQITDPLYHLVSEVEQPEAMRLAIKEWRKGVEIRNKFEYQPETRRASKNEYFSMI